mgnify:CR=1 FL=1
MPPSSTSSSDRRPRNWGAFALILLVAVAGAEIALRRPAVRRLLPPRTHYYHPVIAQRLDAIDRLRAVYERVDVLFVGSSIVLTNVHALLFDQIVAQGGGLVSFNAGLPGLWPTSVHLYAEHVWLPAARPRVVVQGVRYPELAATTHAKNETQVWTGRIEPAWRDSDWLTRLHSAIVARSYVLQYRGALTRRLQQFQDGWNGAVDPEEDDTYAIRGYTPMGPPAARRAEDSQPDLPNDGTCEVGRCDVGFAALRRTIAAVRAAGAEYVLVNVPEHAFRWRGPDGPDRYRHYVRTLQAFAEAERVGFIDPTDGDPSRFVATPYFDLSHMTAAGSRQFTRALAGRMGPVLEAALPGRPLHAEVGPDVGVAADAPDPRVKVVVLEGKSRDGRGQKLLAQP